MILKSILYAVAVGIAQTVLSTQNGLFSRLSETATTNTIQGITTAACDITITIILSSVLNRSRSGIGRSNTIIDKLIIYAINRGAAT
ncbi:hypothetical protein V5O48_019087, partial [Marasmius crinis-equi]